MKLAIPKAFVHEVKTRGEDPEEKVVGIDIKLIAEVDPAFLDEFHPNIRPALFANDAPKFHELGALEWLTQYEKGLMTIHGNKVNSTEIRSIVFTAKPKGILGVAMVARCTPGEEMIGKLAMLIKQEVKVTFDKMVQKPLVVAEEDDEEEPEQQDIVGLIEGEKRQRAKAH